MNKNQLLRVYASNLPYTLGGTTDITIFPVKSSFLLQPLSYTPPVSEPLPISTKETPWGNHGC